MERDQTFVVEMNVSGQLLTLVLDTGASATNIHVKVAERLGLQQGVAATTTGNRTADIPTRQTAIPGFELGELIQPFPLPVDVLDLTAVVEHLQRKAGVRIDGLLGGNFLKAYNALIDYPARMMYLKPARVSWDFHMLQGEWESTAVEFAGDVVTDVDSVRSFGLTVRGRKVRFGQKAHVHSGTLELEVGPPIKLINFANVSLNGKALNDHLTGLYEVGDDRVRVLFPAQRKLTRTELPSELKTTKENGALLVTFRKVRPTHQSTTPRQATPDRNWFDGLPVANLIRRHFPTAAGPHQYGQAAYTLNRDLSITALVPPNVRITFRVDGSATIDNGSGTVVTVHPAKP